MFLALYGSPRPLAAEDAPPGASWRVGLARAKITPSEPVYLAGYASRRKPFTSVLSEIWVKALALEDGGGHRAVLVTSEICGV